MNSNVLTSFKNLDWPLLISTSVASILIASAVTTQSKFMFIAVGLLVGLPVGLVLLRHRYLIFWAILLTSLFNDHAGISIAGLNLRPYSALTPLAIGGLILSMSFDRKNEVCDMVPEMLKRYIPLILLIVSKIVTYITLTDIPAGMSKSFTLKYIIFSILLIATSFVIATHTANRNRLVKSLQIWIHLGNIVALIAVYQLIASNVLGAHYVHHRGVIWFGRPYSVFREPDVLGSFYASIILMVVPMLVGKYHLIRRNYLWFTLGLHTIGIITLFVRAAWVAVVVVGAIWLLSLLKVKVLASAQSYFHRGLLGSVVAFFLIIVLFPSFFTTLSDRFLSLAKPKGEGASEYRMRELTAMAAKTASIRNPETLLLGHGDFTWSYWAPVLLGENYDRTAVDAAKKTGKRLIHAGFCMPLTIFFDNGIIGLFLYLAFLFSIVSRYLKVLPLVNEGDRILLMSTFLPVIAIVVCFIFSYDPISPFLWVLIGLHMATVYIVQNPTQEVTL